MMHCYHAIILTVIINTVIIIRKFLISTIELSAHVYVYIYTLCL